MSRMLSISSQDEIKEHLKYASAVLTLGRSSLSLKKSLDDDETRQVHDLIAQDQMDLVRLFNNRSEANELRNILTDSHSAEKGISLLYSFVISILGAAHLYFDKHSIKLMELARLSARASVRGKTVVSDILLMRFAILDLCLEGKLKLTSGAYQSVSLSPQNLSILLGSDKVMGNISNSDQLLEISEKQTRIEMLARLKVGVVKKQIKLFKEQGLDLQIHPHLFEVLVDQALHDGTGMNGLEAAFLKKVHKAFDVEGAHRSFPIRIRSNRTQVTSKKKEA